MNFGLIGKNISYSFSEQYFQTQFHAKGNSKHQYATFDLESLDSLLVLIKKNNLSGFNITIPYKEEVLLWLDKIDEHANTIKAVNCVKIENQQLIGFNTDYLGFEKSLLPLLQVHHKKALIFGNGGAAKAIKYVLEKNHIDYHVVSRKENLNFKNLTEELISEHKILINTTPVGTFPNVEDVLPIPFQAITASHLVYDLVYNPDKTKWLQLAEQQGAIIKNGLEMLEIQAQESYKIWGI